jgi:ribosomal protein L40E
VSDPWVCIDCGARLPQAGNCRRCGEPLLDAREEKTRDLMRDVDQRRAHTAETRSRWIGVVVGMAVVFGLWLVPGYWLIERAFALPFLFDQWLLMAVIGLGVMFVLRKLHHPRFPDLVDR